jgi:hypothetical protein
MSAKNFITPQYKKNLFVKACCRGSTATFFNQFLSPLQNRYKTLVINVSLFLTFIQKQKELKKNRELNRELRNFR